MQPNRSTTLVALWAALAAVQIEVFAFTPLVSPIAKDLSLSYTQIGLLQTATFVPYAILQVTAGALVDRYPATKIVAVSTAFFTVASVFFAVSESYAQALLFRALMGVSMSFVFVPGIRLAMSSTGPASRGRAVGLYGSSLAAGSIVAAAVPVPLAVALGGWRPALLATNLAGLASVVLLLVFRSQQVPRPAKRSAGRFTISTMRNHQTWVLGYDQFMRFGIATAVSTWIPTFMVEARGFTPVQSGLLLGAIWSLTLLMIPVGGALSDRFSKARIILVKLALLVPAVLAFGLISNGYMIWSSALVIGALMYFDFAALFAILPEMFNEERIGLVTGIENTLASVAGFIFPAVFGFLKDTTGTFESAWVWLAVMTLLGAVASMSLRSR